MDITRNKFSNTVCVIFSVSILALFCLTNKVMLGLDNLVSCAIIAAALCGLVAFISILINRLVNRFSSKIRVDGNLAYIIAISVVSLEFVVIRLLMISNIIEVPLEIGTIYDNAKICADGNINMDFSTAGGILSSLISVFIRFLGNTSLPIIIVQFILSVGAYVLLLFGVKDLLGRVSSFFVCVFVANLPVFFKSIASDRVDNLALLSFAFLIFISGRYKKRMEYYDAKVILSFLIGLLCGIFSLYDKAFLLSFVIPLIVICSNSDETTSNKIFNSVGLVFGYLLGFFVPIVVENFVIGSGDVVVLIDNISRTVMSRLGFCNNIAVLEKTVSDSWISLGLLLCVFYCVYFWKSDEDNGHIIAAFFVLFSLQFCFTNVSFSSEFTMIYIICLVAVAGYGFSKIGYDPGYSSVTKIEDDMQPAIVQMIGTKVVASDEEINKAFNESAENEKKASIEKANDLKYDMDKPENKSKVDLTLRAEEINANKEPKADVEGEVKADTVAQVVDTAMAETETKDFVETKAETENKAESENKAETETKAETEAEVEKEPDYIPQERKYTEPEVRKSSDFGMNDVSFESLFSGTNLPPKSARKDVYDDYYEEVDEPVVEEKQNTEEIQTAENFVVEEIQTVENVGIEETPILEETIELEKPSLNINPYVEEQRSNVEEQRPNVEEETDGMNSADFASLFTGTNIPPKFARNDLFDDYYDDLDEQIEESSDETVAETETIEEPQQDNKSDEASDKKAYVDTFFSYLYDESIFDQPIEMPEHKEPEEKQYVSNASKFADLDIDLGIDAFDYVPEGGENAEGISENPDEAKEQQAQQLSDQPVSADASSYDNEPAVYAEEPAVYAEEPAVYAEEPAAYAEEPAVYAEEPAVYSEETAISTEEASVFAEDSIVFEETTIPNESETSDTMNDAVVLVEKADMLNDKAEELLEQASFNEEFFFIDNNIEEYKETEQQKEIIDIEEEFDFDEVIPSLSSTHVSNENGWDSIDNNSFEMKPATSGNSSLEDEIYNALSDSSISKEPEISIEEELIKKLNSADDFSYEEAIENRIAEEEMVKQNGFSYEEILEKKLDVEESIKKAEEKIVFSVEEALSNKLILEESLASNDENVSLEEVLAKKIEVEEEYNNNIADDGFSFTEAIEQKIDLENHLSAEINRSVTEEIETPLKIDEFVFDEGLSSSQNVSSDEFTPVAEEVFAVEDISVVEDIFAEDIPVVEDKFVEDIPATENVLVEDFPATENVLVEDIPTTENVPVEEEKKPVELIENPLPLPKKHVHRELDYGRSVPENWMHYDVKIDSKNDFFDV